MTKSKNQYRQSKSTGHKKPVFDRDLVARYVQNAMSILGEHSSKDAVYTSMEDRKSAIRSALTQRWCRAIDAHFESWALLRERDFNSQFPELDEISPAGLLCEVAAVHEKVFPTIVYVVLTRKLIRILQKYATKAAAIAASKAPNAASSSGDSIQTGTCVDQNNAGATGGAAQMSVSLSLRLHTAPRPVSDHQPPVWPTSMVFDFEVPAPPVPPADVARMSSNVYADTTPVANGNAAVQGKRKSTDAVQGTEKRRRTDTSAPSNPPVVRPEGSRRNPCRKCKQSELHRPYIVQGQYTLTTYSHRSTRTVTGRAVVRWAWPIMVMDAVPLHARGGMCSGAT